MAQFFGSVHGAKGEATRLGTKKSGMGVYAAGWSGRVSIHMWHDEKTGKDMFRVDQDQHHGAGVSRPVLFGEVGGTVTFYAGGDVEVTREGEQS